MALPSTEELESVIVQILTRAQREGRLDQLTVRIVLRELATHYGIEEDVFHSRTYKPFIKSTVHATVNSLEDASDRDAGPPPRKEAKSDSVGEPRKRKRPSVQETPGQAGASESGTPPPKKVLARSRPSKARDDRTVDKPAKSGKTSKKPESDSKYKSKAIIESSDEEAAPESGPRKSVSSPKGKTTSKLLPPKLKQQQKVDGVDSDFEIDVDEDPGPSSSSSKPKSVAKSPKPSSSKGKELTRNPMESELSSAVDEPQPKRKKKQDKGSVKHQKDEKTKREKKEPLSKDEETVNKLKGIVLACGVRKVWKKEFEGLDKASQQIKRLHSILGELGMTPRYSLEKAKTIREQRELAQELKDVQEFDRAMKRCGKGGSSSETAESVGQDGSDADAPVRKKQNARASIMAFLQGLSDEE